MNMTEIRKIAGQHNIKPGRLPKSVLIRSIQKAEGFFDCFDTNNSYQCGQEQCLWRQDCDRRLIVKRQK